MLADYAYYCVRKISRETLLGRLLRLPLKMVPKNLTVRILSGVGRGKKWILGSAHVAVWIGFYEIEVQEAFERFVSKGEVVYDIGSHVGFFTIIASELVGSKGKVVAFEPMETPLHYLREHLRLNNCSNVIVRDVAVSAKAGVARMELGGGDEATRYLLAHMADNGQFEVKTVALDELVFGSELSPPDFIKIDIEGAEYLALQGARRTIEQFRPVICLSTHGEKIREQCLGFLESLGYTWSVMKTQNVVREDELLCVYEGNAVNARATDFV